MKLLITGGTGLIGSRLQRQLLDAGCDLVILSRDTRRRDTAGIRFVSSLEQVSAETQFYAFINLAGESMAEGRWSEGRKSVLEQSRVGTTCALYALAERLQRPPQVLVSASAIGIYGHHGDEKLDEDGVQTAGFSSHLCAACLSPQAGVSGRCILHFQIGHLLQQQQIAPQ
jgi:NAD dependent epimerase/dehydratase family enzyme